VTSTTPGQPTLLGHATTIDGVPIAVSTHGSGPALVWLPPFPFSNVMAQWRMPRMRDVYTRLSRSIQLVQYDGRGTGRSGRDARDFSLDAHVRDLEAVADHAGLGQFAMLGYYHATAVAVRFAARHPERVTRLVLFGGGLRGADLMSPPETQALLTLIERDWDFFAESAAHAWMGWEIGAEGQAVADAFRTATTPAVARAVVEASRSFDVSADVAGVQAPALVLHRQSDRQIPLEIARQLADALPNGRLQVLPGSLPALFIEQPDADTRLLINFLTGTADAASDSTPATAGGMTAREREVLALIAGGSANAEIAHRLGISIHTVERHAANLYRKIGARNRADATGYAIRHGLA
jgi:pimeloyl-ACP methyl ester carboxylesterase/DNA-binding CsgD family transcriptional regulator